MVVPVCKFKDVIWSVLCYTVIYKKGGQKGAEHPALGSSCTEGETGGCEAANLDHLWSTRQKVQDPVAQMAVQTQVL